MPIDLGDLTAITLVADDRTPEPMLKYDKLTIGVPAEQAALLPDDGRPDVLIFRYADNVVSAYGYLRVTSGTALQWVLAPEEDPDLAALASIPGPQGWADPAALDEYRACARMMKRRGISRAELAALRRLYQAAVANHVAQQDAAGR
jgi:hypothetical protein